MAECLLDGLEVGAAGNVVGRHGVAKRMHTRALNASFVEVSPLVDIEALSFGCPIVTTKYALHHELLPPNTPVCEPYDEHSILEWLRWRPDRAEPRPVVDAERCKRTLVETYRELARAGAG